MKRMWIAIVLAAIFVTAAGHSLKGRGFGRRETAGRLYGHRGREGRHDGRIRHHLAHRLLQRMPHPGHPRPDLPQGRHGPGPLGHGLFRRRGRPPGPAPRRIRQGHRPHPPGREDLHLFPHRLLPDERASAGHRREHVLAEAGARRRLRRGRHPPDHDHRTGPGLRPREVPDGPRGRRAHRRRSSRSTASCRPAAGPRPSASPTRRSSGRSRSAVSARNGRRRAASPGPSGRPAASPTTTSSSSPTTSASARSTSRTPISWPRRTTCRKRSTAAGTTRRAAGRSSGRRPMPPRSGRATSAGCGSSTARSPRRSRPGRSARSPAALRTRARCYAQDLRGGRLLSLLVQAGKEALGPGRHRLPALGLRETRSTT